MLRAQCAAQRTAFFSWPRLERPHQRCWRSGGQLQSDLHRSATQRRTPQRTRRQGPSTQAAPEKPQAGNPQHPVQLSLVEQLFPEESRRYAAQQKIAREVPRLPIDAAPTAVPGNKFKSHGGETAQTSAHRALQREMEKADIEQCVLLLRNASLNLVEEDFRRLIPQGKHLEGWTLEQGDIVKVIPGRDPHTLERQDFYFLIFSSPLSAFTYQGHVTRIHKLAAINIPTSVTSVIPPPPGYLVEGLDVHAAMQAYALVPPSQPLELRQLRRPVKKYLHRIISQGGYSSIVDREGRMPFEVRLTLDGPQLSASVIRHTFVESGRARALGWAGGDSDNYGISVTELPRAEQTTSYPHLSTEGQPSGDSLGESVLPDEDEPAEAEEGSGNTRSGIQQRRRTAQNVFIVGFHTLESAQSFVCHWHRRPLTNSPSSVVKENPAQDDFEGDLPPVVNAELLW